MADLNNLNLTTSTAAGIQIKRDRDFSNLTLQCDPVAVYPNNTALPDLNRFKEREPGKIAVEIDVCDLEVANLIIHGELTACTIICPEDFTVTAGRDIRLDAAVDIDMFTVGIQRLQANSTGVSVGTAANILPLIRASAIAANNWEDGYFGNSAAMVFAPGDFLSDVAGRPAIMTSFLVPPITGDRMYVVQSGVPGQYIATKIIPKGFQITVNSLVAIWAQQDSGASFTATLILYVNSLVSNQMTSTEIFPNTTPLVLTEDVAPTPHLFSGALTTGANLPVVGDGLTSIIFAFVPSVALTGAGGVAGASITMERV